MGNKEEGFALPSTTEKNFFILIEANRILSKSSKCDFFEICLKLDGILLDTFW